MQFLFHTNAGDPILTLEGDCYRHLYRARRTRQTQALSLRNLTDDNLYIYDQARITKTNATLHLKETIHSPNRSVQTTHIILGIIDLKSIQKVLPFLNELGVAKLTLFYGDFSQRSEKINQEKLQAILIASSQQCGRSDLLKIDFLENLEEVIASYQQVHVFDFGGGSLEAQKIQPTSILIGPEGGFSLRERKILEGFPIYSTRENIILRSETACIFVASKLHQAK